MTDERGGEAYVYTRISSDTQQWWLVTLLVKFAPVARRWCLRAVLKVAGLSTDFKLSGRLFYSAAIWYDSLRWPEPVLKFGEWIDARWASLVDMFIRM